MIDLPASGLGRRRGPARPRRERKATVDKMNNARMSLSPPSLSVAVRSPWRHGLDRSGEPLDPGLRRSASRDAVRRRAARRRREAGAARSAGRPIARGDALRAARGCRRFRRHSSKSAAGRASRRDRWSRVAPIRPQPVRRSPRRRRRPASASRVATGARAAISERGIIEPRHPALQSRPSGRRRSSCEMPENRVDKRGRRTPAHRSPG